MYESPYGEITKSVVIRKIARAAALIFNVLFCCFLEKNIFSGVFEASKVYSSTRINNGDFVDRADTSNKGTR